MADGIIALLQKKIDALDEILDVTQAQFNLIQGDDIPALMDNIEKRQQLIDHIDELDAVIAGMPALGDREQAAVNGAMLDIRSQLADIAAQDKRNEEAATARLESYKAEAKSAGEYKQVLDAYVEPLFPAERHILDTKK